MHASHVRPSKQLTCRCGKAAPAAQWRPGGSSTRGRTWSPAARCVGRTREEGGGNRTAQAQRLKPVLCREWQRVLWCAMCLVDELHLCSSLLLHTDEERCAASRQEHWVLAVAQQSSGQVQEQLCSQRSLVGSCAQVSALQDTETPDKPTPEWLCVHCTRSLTDNRAMRT